MMKNFLLETVETEKPETPFFTIDNGYAFVPLQDSVGNGRRNREEDVWTIRSGLEKLDYTTEEDMYPEIYTRTLDHAIKNFQIAENLKVDGVLHPKGETEQRLQSKLQEKAETKAPSPRILRGMDNQRVVKAIKEEEGEERHIYLDTKGNPTTGVGFLLPNASVAKEYPFYNTRENRPATAEEIEKSYHIIRSQPHGKEYGAESYKQYSDIVLSPEYIDQKLTEVLQSKVQEVRRKFPDFDNAPGDVQLAILDMQFNIGDTRFRPKYIDPNTGKERGWPKFFEAYHRKDWKEMARQSNRYEVGPKRNKQIYDLLYNAE